MQIQSQLGQNSEFQASHCHMVKLPLKTLRDKTRWDLNFKCKVLVAYTWRFPPAPCIAPPCSHRNFCHFVLVMGCWEGWRKKGVPAPLIFSKAFPLTSVSKCQWICPSSQGKGETPGIEENPYPTWVSLLPLSAMIFHSLSWSFLQIHILAVTIVAVTSISSVRKEWVTMNLSVPLDAKTMVWKAVSLHVGGTKDEE